MDVGKGAVSPEQVLQGKARNGLRFRVGLGCEVQSGHCLSGMRGHSWDVVADEEEKLAGFLSGLCF